MTFLHLGQAKGVSSFLVAPVASAGILGDEWPGEYSANGAPKTAVGSRIQHLHHIAAEQKTAGLCGLLLVCGLTGKLAVTKHQANAASLLLLLLLRLLLH